MATVRVWDPFVRAFHWSLALSFAVAWLSGEGPERLHELAGYATGALVIARVAWGFLGTGYARFSQFVRSPAAVVDYLKSVAAGSERRFVGHNPAGGAMIVILIATLAATAATGWMLTTNAFWGSTLLQRRTRFSPTASSCWRSRISAGSRSQACGIGKTWSAPW